MDKATEQALWWIARNGLTIRLESKHQGNFFFDPKTGTTVGNFPGDERIKTLLANERSKRGMMARPIPGWEFKSQAPAPVKDKKPDTAPIRSPVETPGFCIPVTPKKIGSIRVLSKETTDREPSQAEADEYAEWLGLDKETEQHLWWIARTGLKSPLPKPWQACEAANGDIFYFNSINGNSVWDHPSDAVIKKLLADQRQKTARARGTLGKDKQKPVVEHPVSMATNRSLDKGSKTVNGTKKLSAGQRSKMGRVARCLQRKRTTTVGRPARDLEHASPAGHDFGKVKRDDDARYCKCLSSCGSCLSSCGTCLSSCGACLSSEEVVNPCSFCCCGFLMFIVLVIILLFAGR
mmetsp:Transcript_20021/g.44533  ORF Transcript_20021/g.44533 Transcript_20021/m.44533 type:complete len:350 (+) Transcript_20021:142-1191(+)